MTLGDRCELEADAEPVYVVIGALDGAKHGPLPDASGLLWFFDRREYAEGLAGLLRTYPRPMRPGEDPWLLLGAEGVSVVECWRSYVCDQVVQLDGRDPALLDDGEREALAMRARGFEGDTFNEHDAQLRLPELAASITRRLRGGGTATTA